MKIQIALLSFEGILWSYVAYTILGRAPIDYAAFVFGVYLCGLVNGWRFRKLQERP